MVPLSLASRESGCRRHPHEEQPIHASLVHTHLHPLSFVVVRLARDRYSTPVVKRNLNPEYGAKDATFDFPLFRSTIGHVGALQFVIWDKDLMSKEYLGEIALAFEDFFKHCEPSPAFAFDDPRNTVSHMRMEHAADNRP